MLRASSGIITFSSKFPCIPPTAIAVSLPITWAQIWTTASGITGFTLPGMIDEPFCRAGSVISPSPGARAARHPTQVVADLGERNGEDLQRTRQRDDSVARPLGGETIGWRTDQVRDPRARHRSELDTDLGGEVGMGVQPGAHGGSTQRHLTDDRERGRDVRPCAADLLRIAGELLAQGHRNGIHQMGTTGLDDIGEGLGPFG